MAQKLRESGIPGGDDLSLEAGGPQAATGARMVKSQSHRAQQKAITQGLRKFFDSVAAEPVPSDFMDILKQIDGKKGDA
jgi:hypothetical protein